MLSAVLCGQQNRLDILLDETLFVALTGEKEGFPFTLILKKLARVDAIE
jgi:hypothetical protein